MTETSIITLIGKPEISATGYAQAFNPGVRLGNRRQFACGGQV